MTSSSLLGKTSYFDKEPVDQVFHAAPLQLEETASPDWLFIQTITIFSLIIYFLDSVIFMQLLH